MEQNSNNIESLLAALPPEKKVVFNDWSRAHDEYRDAHLAASTLRDQWSKLYEAFDLKTRARNDEVQAQQSIRDLARSLNIATLPLAPDALKKTRATEEAESHERLKRAKQNLAQAEQALQQASKKDQ